VTTAKELIDDRALEDAAGDRLRHQDLAVELTDVVLGVTTPASIALWGPWGSGKSGLANLLRRDLEQRAPQARFVRFDAFKFAETPLRRHFISQVAEALKKKDSKYREDLYKSTDKTDFEIPAGGFGRLLLVFLIVLLVVEIVATVLMVGLAAVSPGSFATNFNNFVKAGLALALAPAGVLAAFTALAGQTLPVKRTRSAPSGDEEFERLFRDLVKEAKADPLVVFIDELDRCSSEEVVSTLEAVRTFLDVPGVVYVVAADQQVLERALRESARQTTPPDAINPYYSAGSAYLDKIFQYQFSVPPVRTRGLWDFALELTEDLDGIWRSVDRPYVTSILIPTHVRSPRRVKRLLNGFVLTCRLAERRADAERVDARARERVAEIAKLVCLQIEFPLFAADLSVEPRLPDYVLQVRRGEALPKYLPPEVRRRAEGYAEGRLNVDEVIASDGGGEGGVGSPQQEASGGGEEADNLEGMPERPLGERDKEKQGSEVSRVGRIHAEQLVRYLQKTRHVEGPGGDLVFMESRGASFGLDAAVADALGEAAVDGDTEQVRRTIGELDDPELQRAALQLLAQRGAEASIGIGGKNAISSLLIALSVLPDLDLDGIADTLADAVAAHEESEYSLEVDELGGALSLATMSSRKIGQRLMALVLNRPEALNSKLGLQILRESERIPSTFAPRLAEIGASRVIDDPKATVDALVQLNDATLEPMLTELAERVPRRLAELAEAEEAEEPE
jgi:hypothetical protein